MNPIIYLEPWCRAVNIVIIYTFLKIVPFHSHISNDLPPKFWLPMITWHLIVKLERAIMTDSTKICLSSNNTSNHLISLISYILCSLIKCLDNIDFFKIEKNVSPVWDIFIPPQLTWVMWFINWSSSLLSFLETVLQYPRTNRLERFQWATLLKKTSMFWLIQLDWLVYPIDASILFVLP